MARRGFDDDDDTDHDDDVARPRRGDRADRPAGNKRTGSQRREVELASDPSFLWRFIKTNLAAAANDIGRAGYNVPAVSGLLDAVERTFGPRLAGLGINAVAAAVQNPQIVKTQIRNFGWPEQVNGLIDEFIDDLFEGLRMGLREGHKKIDESVVHKAERDAMGNLRAKINRIEIKSLDQGLGFLTAVEHAQFVDALGRFSADQQKSFQYYRNKLALGGIGAIRAFIRTAAAAPVATRAAACMEYLNTVYGPPPQPISNTIVDTIVGGIRALDTAAQKHLGVPDPDHDPVADRIEAYASRVRRRRGA